MTGFVNFQSSFFVGLRYGVCMGCCTPVSNEGSAEYGHLMCVLFGERGRGVMALIVDIQYQDWKTRC